MKLKCPICFTEGNFRSVETDCHFISIEGIDQHLVRYKCSSCDLVFGPLQMINLSKNDLKAAYEKMWQEGYREADSSDCEIRALKLLNPSPSGMYLNWGAGESTAAAKAKEIGFNLINYDPFINVSLSLDKVDVKYDGIISNNVIEHLQDPIDEFLKMKSLLKPGAKMIHMTDCYLYRVEYTKFHLFFFVGRSLKALCNRTGLQYRPIDNNTVEFWST